LQWTACHSLKDLNCSEERDYANGDLSRLVEKNAKRSDVAMVQKSESCL